MVDKTRDKPVTTPRKTIKSTRVKTDRPKLEKLEPTKLEKKKIVQEYKYALWKFWLSKTKEGNSEGV